jgi:hypothetical protein
MAGLQPLSHTTEGVSLNQFIAAAVAEKVGSLRAADDFLRERAGTAKPDALYDRPTCLFGDARNSFLCQHFRCLFLMLTKLC